jgi:hypothetical protein
MRGLIERSLLAFCIALSACGGGTHAGDDDDVGGADGDADADTDADADGDADPDCVDLDGDGAGIGCVDPDCDDTDPTLITQCGEDCAANPERTGCPCDAQQIAPCYSGPAGTVGQGVCAAGLRSCGADLTWGGCVGQVLPSADVETVCNDLDDNCDGVVDEGLRGPCGDCNEECSGECVGVGCDEGFLEDEGRSLVQNPDGSITLNAGAAVTNFLIWVANTQEGTVSKIDTRAREEMGRYITMPPEIARGNEASPSRTTVNPHGDVVVSNRHVAVGGSTKILSSDCPDQDHDGTVETSDGGGNILPWGEDECVVWYVADISAARGSAFEIRGELDGGSREYVWIASYPLANGGTGTVYEIDSIDGEKTGREIPDTPGYGLAMGPGGLLWSTGLGACPRSTDTTSLQQTRYEGCGRGAYGIAVDAEGRPWIGSDTARLDLDTLVWEHPVDADGEPISIGGGGITVDAFGNAYTGEWQHGYKIDAQTMEATPLPGMGGHGWAVDFDGFIWSVELGGTTAKVMDPETFEVESVRPPFINPYTYSDMTGFQLQNTVTPAGVYQRVFETCDPEQRMRLTTLEWAADVPAGASVAFRLRHADTIDALEAMPWIAVASVPPARTPVDLEAVLSAADVDLTHIGQYLMIEATLTSVDRRNRPTLYSFGITYSCSGHVD